MWGRLPCVKTGDNEADMDDTQVGRGPRGGDILGVRFRYGSMV